MDKKRFHSRRKELLNKCTDEQLRAFWFSIASELESRLHQAHKKFFTNPATGTLEMQQRPGWEWKT